MPIQKVRDAGSVADLFDCLNGVVQLVGLSGGSTRKPTPQLRRFGSFEYALLRSRRKSMAIEIRDGRVIVRVPMRASQVHIEEMLGRHANWVAEKLRQAQQRLQNDHERNLGFSHGCRLLLQGRELTVVEDPSCQQVCITEETIRTPSRARLQSWLITFAKTQLDRQLQEVSESCGLVPMDWKLSQARGRWGSCNSKGIIRLSWRLVFLPAELSRHVIAHELAHLAQMNHSRLFWQRVAAIDPDFQEHRCRLRQLGHLLRLC